MRIKINAVVDGVRPKDGECQMSMTSSWLGLGLSLPSVIKDNILSTPNFCTFSFFNICSAKSKSKDFQLCLSTLIRNNVNGYKILNNKRLCLGVSK